MKRIVKEVKTFLFHKNEYEFVKYDWEVDDLKAIKERKRFQVVDDENNRKVLDMLRNNTPIKNKKDTEGILIGAEAMYMDTETNELKFGEVSLQDLKYTLQARDIEYCYPDMKGNIFVSYLTPRDKIKVLEYDGEKINQSKVITGLHLNVIDVLGNKRQMLITATYRVPNLNRDVPILYGNLTSMVSGNGKEFLDIKFNKKDKI